MVYSLFNKKIRFAANDNKVLGQELHKRVIKKIKKKKVYARFKDNIWTAYYAGMGSLSCKSRGIKYLLCVIGVFTKYV